MADVFISYSRRDSEFVHRIHDVLKTQGREVWVDFEDIPPSAEWMNEIRAAIEASTSVVFIITPNSAASPSGRAARKPSRGATTGRSGSGTWKPARN